MQFTATVEKENEFKQLKCEDAYLTEIGGGIAHTVTCREPGFSVQHSNLVIEVDKMIDVLNPMDDGTCRTIKNQYGQTSAPNLASQGTFGASGGVQAIKIRQATEQGFALCEIGGGSRLGLSNISNKTRASNRERKNLSDTDNGEYP